MLARSMTDFMSTMTLTVAVVFVLITELEPVVTVTVLGVETSRLGVLELVVRRRAVGRVENAAQRLRRGGWDGCECRGRRYRARRSAEQRQGRWDGRGR